MKLPFLVLLLCFTHCHGEEAEGVESEIDYLKSQLGTVLNHVDELRTIITKLSRQTMLQQFAVEERSRVSGNSGIKVIRSRRRGLKNYDSPSHVGYSVNAIHDHSNYIRTIGMGEISVMMGGVEFRTRHNDYKLVMPSTNSTEYHVTEPIPFPEVPPSVQGTIQEQVDEMAEYFKAFKTQNTSLRNYTNYFKPILCYMEGAWTLDETLQEPFKSERHRIDAKSWFDLQEKIKFATLSGTKSGAENLAYLPTTIQSVNETTGESIYAQWNYRILCQPIKKNIPLSSLKFVEDLSYRMRNGKTVEQTLQSRAARFKLYDDEMSNTYQLLDQIFYTVPGMDNIPSDELRQETFGQGDLYDVSYTKTDVVLKNGYYNRQYKYSKKGAMGLSVNPRGFNDENFWVAQTTQSRIAPVCLESCKRELQPNGRRPFVCKEECNRFTYAIPLEIVYLTPLLSWNPHNINISQDHKTAVSKGGNGVDKPFFGADWNRYYLTPVELYSKAGTSGAADTPKAAVKIYDSMGVVRKTAASGSRIWTGDINGVGPVRLRYPIAPVADESSSVWKELTALKDLFYSVTKIDVGVARTQPQDVRFQMSTTLKDPPGEHTHDVLIPFNLFKDRLMNYKYVDVTSMQAQGHTHELRIRYNRTSNRFYYTKCDNSWRCWDEHPNTVFIKTDNEKINAFLPDRE